MHDPSIVAFEIKNPFVRKDRHGYRPCLVTIWHEDPETDGSDDSCGWSSVNLSQEDSRWCEDQAQHEWEFWFSPKYASIGLLNASELSIVAAAWGWARWRVRGTHPRTPLSAWDMSHVFHLCTSSCDNFGHLVAAAKTGPRELERMLALTLRVYRTAQRKPWQHPRWHFWHWRFQVHPWQAFCRWMWSRCEGCGKRFAWGYAPCSMQWNGDGAKAFRGEKAVFHAECVEHRRDNP